MTVRDTCSAAGICFKVLLGWAGGRRWPTAAGNGKQQEHVADDEGSNEEVEGSKGNDNGGKDGGARVTATKVAGNKEGEGIKVMATATRVAGEQRRR